jgi:predicted amidohydrolase
VDRIRVASLQYYIRPIRSFEQFADQVRGLVETAADYGCHLVVFPEYCSLQLLTLGDITRPIPRQIRTLASYVPRYEELLSGLAKQRGMYIVGGSFPVVGDDDQVHNDAYVFSPTGASGVQGKLHMTRFESEEWGMKARARLRLFETSFGRMAVNICYDVEFPELARVAAHADAYLLVVPSCTDDRQGFLRVRYCAHARAVENQLYVIHSPLVGSLPMVPAVSLNYGEASILTPSDFAFARDGILAQGVPNQEMMVIGELNLQTVADSRARGTVLPLRDSRRSAEVASAMEILTL